MSNRLFTYIAALNIVTGFRLYIHTKTKSLKGIHLPFLKHPVYFRKTISDRTMFEQIFVNGEYNIIVPFKPQCIVDLGANVGYASVYFANRFPDARIFALEPDTENFASAQKNTAHYKNIQMVKGAVWHKKELLSIKDHGHGEAALTVQTGDGELTIRGYTIHEIIGLLGVAEIDVLKVDIEGSEKEIFENGSKEWIPKTKIIIVETHDRYRKGTSKALFKAISKYNFSLALSGENLILYNNDLLPHLHLS